MVMTTKNNTMAGDDHNHALSLMGVVMLFCGGHGLFLVVIMFITNVMGNVHLVN